MVTDNPDQRIPQKMFHSRMQHNFAALRNEETGYEPFPDKQREEKVIRETFLRVKREVKAILADKLGRVMNSRGMPGIITKK